MTLSTGIWTETGPMTTARYEDTSTLLPNGQGPGLAGGFDSSGILSSAEWYNPSVGNWYGDNKRDDQCA